MNQLLQLSIVLLIAIVFHELGHYLTFKYYGFNPNIKINWIAISIGEDVSEKLKFSQMSSVLAIGILLGLPFVIFNSYTLIVYILMCGLDIIFLMGIREQWKKYGNIEIYKYYIYNGKEYEKKYGGL